MRVSSAFCCFCGPAWANCVTVGSPPACRRTYNSASVLLYSRRTTEETIYIGKGGQFAGSRASRLPLALIPPFAGGALIDVLVATDLGSYAAFNQANAGGGAYYATSSASLTVRAPRSFSHARHRVGATDS